jgi:dTDP-4-amino-4,6-dideoxygalactose transaminase
MLGMIGSEVRLIAEQPRWAVGGRRIPVYRSKLPSAERLLPYLKLIDRNRWYTNRGELVRELERRLSQLFGSRGDVVVTASSGTSAIEGAILASAGRATPERPLALIPAYTFVATAIAAERCGYVPYFVDIDVEGWMAAPERLVDHRMLSRTGLVVPVAPYGRPPPQVPWRDFMRRTGIPIVIDGAAAFEAIIADPARFTGAVPIALSFQATKPFSTGEGGAVVWSDADGLARVVGCLNFGFRRWRDSESPGINGKMSEYHAAVGLASLDEWATKVAANRTVAGAYRRASAAHGIGDRITSAPDIASNYVLLMPADAAQAADVIRQLSAEDIEYRLWYGLGLHKQTSFSTAGADPLPITDDLAPRLVALPAFEDLTGETIERIIGRVARSLAA